MRILVTGRDGQVASALAEAAFGRDDVHVITCGRPALDLEIPATLADAIRRHDAVDVVVNAAAWTAVDAAEQDPARVHRINAVGAGLVAAAARDIGAPIIQISTDYVFSGSLARPYREDDLTGPLGVYGASKLAGERLVAEANSDHAILRTSWLHAAMGKNFLRTMLTLAETRSEIGVVADQFGAPTFAPDLADGILAIAENMLRERGNADFRGVFHITSSGEALSWADFAVAIFEGASRRGITPASVRRLTSADYPSPVRRPANSRLDCTRLAEAHRVTLPHWSDGIDRCLDRLIGPIQN